MNWLAALAIGGWAGSIASIPSNAGKALLVAPAPIWLGLRWIFARHARWLHLLFFSLILLPPFPASFGNSGAHVAPLCAGLGLLAGIRNRYEWSRPDGGIGKPLLLFLATAFGSTALALLYSGPMVATGSAVRVLLFTIGVYVFFFANAGPAEPSYSPWASVHWMYGFAVVAAAFACVDFYFQLPAPAGFGPQYIWIASGVFRRAQGLFYEASTLGNFCAFFLTMIMVAAVRQRERFSPIALAAGAILFVSALLFSYSRASALNVAVAGIALLYVRRIRVHRLIIPAVIVALLTVAILRFATPQFFDHYFVRVSASFNLLGQAPDRVLSGRLANWVAIWDFIRSHPLRLILGIGYKTLPYSGLFAEGVVADNTYLSLLVETGFAGLALFIALNAAMLRGALRAARRQSDTSSFFGTWFFCFWCGELVQMMSGDLITYWRVLPLYFWVLGTATRERSE